MLTTPLDPRALLRDHERQVYAIALRRLGDAGLAADVTQEVFIQAWQRLDQLREPTCARAWITRIAHRATSRAGQRRDRRRDIEARAPAPTPEPEDPQGLAELRALVREAIAALAPEDQELIALRYEQNLSQRDIAELLELPRSTLQSRLNRIHDALEQRLAPRLPLAILPALCLPAAPPPELSERLWSLADAQVLPAPPPNPGDPMSADPSPWSAAKTLSLKAWPLQLGLIALSLAAGAALRPEPAAPQPPAAPRLAEARPDSGAQPASPGADDAPLPGPEASRSGAREAGADALQGAPERPAELRARLAAAEAALAQARAQLAEAAPPSLRELVAASNERAAGLAILRTLISAQALFCERDPEGDGPDTGSLEELGADGLIDPELATGEKVGWRIAIVRSRDERDFAALASPLHGAGPHLFATSAGQLYSSELAPINPRGPEDLQPSHGAPETGAQPAHAALRERLREPEALFAELEALLAGPFEDQAAAVGVISLIPGGAASLPKAWRLFLVRASAACLDDPILGGRLLRELHLVDDEALALALPALDRLLGSGRADEAVSALSRSPTPAAAERLAEIALDRSLRRDLALFACDALAPERCSPARLSELLATLRADASLEARRAGLRLQLRALDAGCLAATPALVTDWLDCAQTSLRQALAESLRRHGDEAVAAALTDLERSAAVSPEQLEAARAIAAAIRARPR